MRAPCIVIDDGPGAADEIRDASASLEGAGWRIVEGLDARPGAVHVVLRGSVATEPDAAAAVLAALDGYGLLVRAAAPRLIIDRVVDDLRRLGVVDHRTGATTSPATPADPTIHPDGRAILGLLAEGHSLGEAAHILGMSRRTADRRLADARQALGVERTTGAIARAGRLGWLRRPAGH